MKLMFKKYATNNPDYSNRFKDLSNLIFKL